ncbi:MAG: FG-GAP-like repeat-containing protein [Bacteroidia bacterium]
MNFRSRVSIAAALLAAILGIVYFTTRVAPADATINTSQPISSSFSVNACGNATWSMDIEVPPGIQNIEPALSVNYTSQTSNGLLGVGFDLEGLSEITRAGASFAQDGFNGGVSFSATDRFQLDGNRLMVMKGNYGAAGSTYHTQRESWTKVVAVGQNGSGPQYFQVWTKQGVYFEYGSTTDARVTATGEATSFPAGSVRQWLVNKCTDLHGNTLTINYTQAPPDSSGTAISVCEGQGQSYPLRIDYTSNDSVKALRSVQFFYEARPDSSMNFTGGAGFSTRARMTAIRTYVKDAKGDSTLVREVRFQYATQTPLLESRLAAVQVKAGDCAYAPSTFTWSQGQDTLIGETITWHGNGNNVGFVGDFNGDGKNDILQSNAHVYFGAETGFIDAGNSGLMYNTSMNNFVGDFNGDGISDFMAGSSQGGTIYYYDQQTHQFSTHVSVTGINISTGCYPTKCVWQGDFNGDGLSDLCSSINPTTYVNFGNSSAGMKPAVQQTNLSVYKGNTYAADFNGDGLTDIFSCNSNTGYLTISNWSDSSGFRPSITIPNMNFTISSTQSYTWVGDYNGDGLADLLAKGSDSNYRIYYSNGNGFQSPKIISINLNTTAVWPADFNHDGMMDFYATTTDNGTIYLSNGLDFSAQEQVNYQFQQQYTWLGDFNGDGLTDLFNAYSKQVFYGGNAKATAQNSNQQASLITTISNGTGATYSITYKPITDSAVYSPGISGTANVLEGQRALNAYNPFPLSSVQNQQNGIISIQQAMYVVSEWTETDGRGAAYNYQCNYSGAKYDMNGYGFLGFAKTKITGFDEGAVLQTFYLQNFPFTGMTDSTALTGISGELYKTSSYVWDSVAVKSATSVPAYTVLQQVKNTFSIYQDKVSNQQQQLCWYDAFGNTRLTATTGDVAHPATIWIRTSYENDTSDWQLGFEITSSQSSDSSGSNPLSAVKIGYTAQRDVDSLYTWFSSGNTWLIRTFGYDVFGNQLTQTGYDGDATTIVYDSIYHSFPVRNYSPRNAQGISLQVNAVYEPFYGKKVKSIDENGNIFSYGYDALGRLRKSYIPDSSGQQTLAVQINYLSSDTGYIVQQIGLRNWYGTLQDTIFKYYDGLSRNFKKTSLGWNNQKVFSENKFNAQGRITASSLPYFSTANPVWGSAQYDPAGRVTRSVIPFENNDSSITSIHYQGQTIAVTRAAGSSDSAVSAYTYTYYNNKPCITNFLNAAGATTTYSWDLLGRIRNATDADGNQTAAQWNSLNLNDWYYSTSFDTTFFVYEPLQLTQKTINALHDTVSYVFDALGRLILNTATHAAPVTFLYDVATVENGLGNLCSVTQDNGATSYAFAYDALGNTNAEQTQLDGHSWQQTSSYNPDFSPASLIFPDGTQASWEYNSAGQPTAVTRKTTTSAAIAVTTVNDIDAFGNWLNYSYGNGVLSQKDFYTDGTLQNMLVSSVNNTAYLSTSFSWNKHGLITGIDNLLNASANETYGYNPTERLTSVTASGKKDSLAYDAVGNLTWNDSITFSYSGYQVNAGEYKGKTIYSAQYNAAGQLCNRTKNDEAQTHAYRYAYDAYGRMDSVYRNDTLINVYTYDYTGSRNRVKNILQTSINYQVSDQYSELVTGTEQHGSCNFSMGGFVMASFHDSNHVEYYSSNQNSSTVLVTSGDGNVLERLSYSPFGKLKKQTADTSYAQYKFNGKEFDAGSDLYYFGSRYYDPFSCRFISPDDQLGGGLVTPDALNNYAFVNNSPITLSDPSGHTGVGTKTAEEVLAVLVVGTLEGVADVASGGTATAAEIAIDEALLVEAVSTDVVTIAIDETSTVSAAVEEQVTATPEKSNVLGKRKRGTVNYAPEPDDEPGSKRPDNEEDDDEYTEKRPGRPGYGAGTERTVFENARDVDGHVFCAQNCGTELKDKKTFKRGSKTVRDWQMGHKQAYEYVGLRKLFDDKVITEPEYFREYRDPNHYQPECPPCNLNHQNERPERAKKNYKESIKAKGRLKNTTWYMQPPDRLSIPAYRKEENWWEQEPVLRRAA